MITIQAIPTCNIVIILVNPAPLFCISALKVEFGTEKN